MDDDIHMCMLFTYIFTISFILIILPPSHCQPQPPPDSDIYSECKNKFYNCGNLSRISYPFWGGDRPSHCGSWSYLVHLTCDDNQTTTIFDLPHLKVLDIQPHLYIMRLVQTDLAEHVCSILEDTDWSLPPFRYPESVHNITISYDCSSVDLSSPYNFKCGSENVSFVPPWEEYEKNPTCKRHIPVPSDAPGKDYDDGGLKALQRVLNKGFEVHYESDPACGGCSQNGGVCGIDDNAPYGFRCYNPPSKSKSDVTRKTIVGVIAMTVGVLIGITVFCFSCKSSISKGEFCLTTKNNDDIEAFLKNHGAQTLKRYKFSDVKKMTNSFKVKLGQGGFGVVYKGKLLTGCHVAVKILNPSKGNNKDFINEVASISRTSHVNVVTLQGFCLEGRKKALIYEFMSNGSLDKFIYRKETETTPPLSLDVLYQIVIGIARGLEYLHRGCNTRILHFDIKPHNILLDEHFCPKISDFGLAKICPKESLISMSDARGTLGYVAPEVWNRHFGRVSHKSDVYSYGMMLLEMVGGRKNINAEASHTSEIYFPQWVYKRLEEGIDFRLNEVINTKENEIAKKIIMVGLWCIQTNPNDRPTMRRVIDMLEDNTNSLEMPPKPFLSSPTRPVAESSISLN